MAAPPPPYPQNPQMPPPYPPQRRKSRVWLWVLGILGTIFLIFVLLVGAGAYFIRQKMHQAGVTTEMMRRNPALASAKIAAAMNPNIEIVSVDEDQQTLTFRDKRTGKVSVVTFQNAKNGRWTATEEEKKP